LAARLSEPVYTTEVLRLAASLQEPKVLERVDGQAEVRSPTCGSLIKVAVHLDDERRILAVSQTVQACAFGQASAALVELYASGRNHSDIAEAMVALSRWLAQEREDAGDWPGLGALEPARSRTGRHGAILLPFRALLSAMEDAR
jgi:NifU-like protein involved in Fe-S cluster formation